MDLYREGYYFTLFSGNVVDLSFLTDIKPTQCCCDQRPTTSTLYIIEAAAVTFPGYSGGGKIFHRRHFRLPKAASQVFRNEPLSSNSFFKRVSFNWIICIKNFRIYFPSSCFLQFDAIKRANIIFIRVWHNLQQPGVCFTGSSKEITIGRHSLQIPLRHHFHIICL